MLLRHTRSAGLLHRSSRARGLRPRRPRRRLCQRFPFCSQSDTRVRGEGDGASSKLQVFESVFNLFVNHYFITPLPLLCLLLAVSELASVEMR